VSIRDVLQLRRASVCDAAAAIALRAPFQACAPLSLLADTQTEAEMQV
jgi:hypothetical protein